MNALRKFLEASKWWVPLLTLLGIIWFSFFAKVDIQTQQQIVSQQLKPGEKQKIIVQQTKRDLTIVTDKGIEHIDLPNHPYSITLTDDNKLVVQTRKKGLGLSPFVGLNYEKNLRGYVGSDIFFFRRLDVGIGVSLQFIHPGKDIRLMVSSSYTVWSNTSVYVGIDNQKKINFGIKVRL